MNSIQELADIPFIDIPLEVHQYAFNHKQSYDRFCCYIDTYDDKPVLRYFAYKSTQKKGLEITEVGRRSPYIKERQVARNIRYTQIAGYKAVYSIPMDDSTWNCYRPCDFNVWFTDTAYGYYAENVNTEKIFEFKDFRYCGYSGIEPLAPYLELYIENPAVEFFGKLGIRFSKVLLNRCKKDKQFRSFLIRNAADANVYGVQATMYAYKNHVSIEEARRICYENNRIKQEVSRWYTSIRQSGLDIMTIKRYVDTHGTYLGSYNDYIHSVMELGLDLNDTKNAFPKDFQRMHDLRIDEYQSMQARKKLEAMLKQDSKFNKVANSLSGFCYSDGKYMMIIPLHIEDLIREGKLLKHCVGKMGYDQKMIDGKSFIAFVRRVEKPHMPLVTVEYDPKRHKVLQQYGKHDSVPSGNVIKFISEWSEKVKAIKIS